MSRSKKTRKIDRLISFLLVFVMIFSFIGTAMPSTVVADEPNGVEMTQEVVTTDEESEVVLNEEINVSETDQQAPTEINVSETDQQAPTESVNMYIIVENPYPILGESFNVDYKIKTGTVETIDLVLEIDFPMEMNILSAPQTNEEYMVTSEISEGKTTYNIAFANVVQPNSEIDFNFEIAFDFDLANGATEFVPIVKAKGNDINGSIEIEKTGDMIRPTVGSARNHTDILEVKDTATGNGVQNVTINATPANSSGVPNGNPVRSATSDVWGQTTFSNIPVSSYANLDVADNQGYYMTGTTINNNVPFLYYTGFIDQNHTTIPRFGIYVTRNAGNVDIKAVDASTNAPLSGAKFRYVGGQGHADKTVTTGANGIATNPILLSPGSYTTTVILPPPGYILAPVTQPTGFSIPTGSNPPKQTITYKFVRDLPELEVHKYDSVTNADVPGALIRVYSGSTLLQTKITASTGIATFNGLAPGNYTYKEFSAPAGYNLNPTSYPFTVTSANVTQRLQLPNTPKQGYVEVTKRDENGNPLPGATFQILDASNNVLDTMTTGTNGKATNTVPLGAPGVYTLRETVAPPGYSLNLEDIKFNITSTTTAANPEKLTIYNGNLNNIQVNKTDDSNNPLAGATFNITKNSNGANTDNFTTNSLGVGVPNVSLAPGTYKLTETTAPTGYIKSNEVFYFPISATGTDTAQIDVVNTKIGNDVEVVKKDINGNPLQGTQFAIKNSANVTVETITTDANGYATNNLITLVPGSYTLVETVASPGQVVNLAPISFTVSSLQTVPTKFVVYNGSNIEDLKVVKTDDSSPALPLNGAVFTLKDSFGNTVDTFTTGSNGTNGEGVPSITLAPGTYILKEASAPAGFLLTDTNQYVFPVSASGSVTLEIDVENARGTGSGAFSGDVYNAGSSPHANLGPGINVTFTDMTNVQYTAITGVNGRYSFPNLPYGNYIVTVNGVTNYQNFTNAPAGFTTSAVNNVYDIPMVPLAGTAMGRVKVVDSLTGLPLTGASVTLNGTTVTTDAQGYARFFPLTTPGTYNALATMNGYNPNSGLMTLVANDTFKDITIALTASANPMGAIYGQVTDSATLAGIPGANVTTLSGQMDTSDSFGYYSIINVPPGNHNMTASATGYNTGMGSAAVTSGQSILEDFVLDPAVIGSEKYVVTGRVTDVLLAPLTNATVTDAIIGTVNTDGFGYYVIGQFNTGSNVSLTGAAPTYTSLTNIINSISQDDILNFILPRTGNVTGNVYVAGSAPPASLGAGITVTYTDSTNVSYNTFTNTNGDYNFMALPAGVYTVTVSNVTGYQNYSSTTTVVNGVTNVYDIPMVPLAGTAMGRVKVVDSLTNFPLTGASVTLNGTTVTTDAQGYARFFPLTTPGTYNALATMNGYNPNSGLMTLVANDTFKDITIALTASANPMGAIYGQVTDSATLAGIPGANVTTLSGQMDTSDSFGYYSIINVPPGNHNMTASATGYNTGMGSAAVTSGQSILEDFVLDPAVIGSEKYVVTGRVTDVLLAPLTNATVTDAIIGTVNTDGFGYYVIGQFNTGSNVSLTGAAPTYTSLTNIINSISQDDILNFILPRTGNVTGNVYVAGSAPPASLGAGITVTYTDSTNVSYNTFTNTNGDYNFMALPAGVYTVTVSNVTGYQNYSSTTTVVNGVTNVYDIPMVPLAGTAMGRVKVVDSLTNFPLTGASVTLNGTTVTTDAQGYARFFPLTTPGTYNALATMNGYNPNSGLMTLVANDTFKDITISLTASANPMGAIYGQVTDSATFAGIPGANVTTLSGQMDTSDSFGYYSIINVPPGNHNMTASATGYNTGMGSAAVTSGQSILEDFVLDPAVIGSEKYVVTGRVTDVLLAPLTNATVTDAIIGTVNTDGFGYYVIGQFNTGSNVSLTGAAPTYTSLTNIINSISQDDILNFILPRTGNVTGNVYVAGSAPPASLGAGITVTYTDSTNVSYNTFTNTNGDYNFMALPAGVYTVTVSNVTGYQNYSSTTTVVNGVANVYDIPMVPLAGTAMGRVKVVDSLTGLPLTGASVTLNGTTVTTDAQGYARFFPLTTPGTYNALATMNGYNPNSGLMTLVANDTFKDITIALTASANPMGAIYGQVTDSATLAGIPGANVTTLSGQMDTSDSFGYYSIINVPPGNHNMTASATGYNTGMGSAAVTSGQSILEDFVLDPAVIGSEKYVVTGRVTDVLLAPLTNATVTDAIIGTVNTDGFGYYVIGQFNTGSNVSLTGAAPTYTSLTNIINSISQDDILNFILPRTGNVTGNVYVAGSAPPASLGAGITVTYTDSTNVSYNTFTNTNGDYNFMALPAGVYTVTVSNVTGYQNYSSTTTVVNGVTNVYDIPMVPLAGTAMGRVKVVDSLTNFPLTGASVTLNGTTVTTDAQGYARFFPLTTPGTYNALATMNGYNPNSGLMTLVANDTFKDITIALTASANPMGAIYGQVTDSATLAGIPGANVTTLSGQMDTSDSFGYYSIINVPPGNHNMTASATGYNTGMGSAAVTSGQSILEDFVLDPAVIGSEKYVVTGRVTDVLLAPLTNATVTDAIIGTVNTDGFGYYVIGQFNTGSNVSLTGAAPTYTSLTNIINSISQDDILNFILPRTGNVTGNVYVAGSAPPASLGAGITVTYTDSTNVSYNTFTNTNGDYNFMALPAGVYTVTVSNVTGYQNYSSTTTVVNGVTNVYDIPMVPLAGTAMGRVKVVDSLTNFPLTGASVTLNGTTVTTDAQGYARFFPLTTPGTYNALATMNGYNPNSGLMTLVANDTFKDITISLTASANPMGAIYGQVTDSATFAGIPGANVTTLSGQMDTSDSFGYYSIINVPPGNHNMTASATGYNTGMGSAAVTSGQSILEDFVLDPAVIGSEKYVVTGRVTDVLLAPLTNATVTDAIIGTVNTDGFGYYVIGQFNTGSNVSLTGAAPTYTSLTNIINSISQDDILNFILPRTGNVTGNVYVAGSAPPASLGAGITVTYTDSTNVSYNTFTNTNGDYNFMALPAGVYTVTVSNVTGYQNYSSTTTVVNGVANVYDIPMVPLAGTAMGRVKVVDSLTNFPLTGASVTLSGTTVTTDAQGYARFFPLTTPGTYNALATMNGYNPNSGLMTLVANDTFKDITISLTASANPMGAIYGQVTDSATFAGIPGANVTTLSGQMDTSDSFGYYSIINVPPGNHNMTASATGYNTEINSVTAISGQSVLKDFQLDSNSLGTTTYIVAGKITDVQSGNSLLGATVNTSQGSVNVDGFGYYATGPFNSGDSLSLTAIEAQHNSMTRNINGIMADMYNFNFALTPRINPMISVYTSTDLGPNIWQYDISVVSGQSQVVFPPFNPGTILDSYTITNLNTGVSNTIPITSTQTNVLMPNVVDNMDIVFNYHTLAPFTTTHNVWVKSTIDNGVTITSEGSLTVLTSGSAIVHAPTLSGYTPIGYDMGNGFVTANPSNMPVPINNITSDQTIVFYYVRNSFTVTETCVDANGNPIPGHVEPAPYLAISGSTQTVSAHNMPGYVCTGGTVNGVPFTGTSTNITVIGNTNVVFEYAMAPPANYPIVVNTSINNGATWTYNNTVTVPTGGNASIVPPSMSGYNVQSYYINGGSHQTVNLQSVPFVNVTMNYSIVFIYTIDNGGGNGGNGGGGGGGGGGIITTPTPIPTTTPAPTTTPTPTTTPAPTTTPEPTTTTEPSTSELPVETILEEETPLGTADELPAFIPSRETFMKIPNKVEVAQGEYIDYTLSGIGNPYTAPVQDFAIGDNPPKGLTFVEGYIPAFTNGEDVTYSVLYETNKESMRVLYSDIDASEEFTFKAPYLSDGEYITSIVLSFGEVPVEFGFGNKITYTFLVTETETGKQLQNKGFVSFKLFNQDIIIPNEGNSTVTVYDSLANKPNPSTNDIKNTYLLLTAISLVGVTTIILVYRTKKRV